MDVYWGWRRSGWGALVAAFVFAGCGGSGEAPEAAAHVENPVTERELTTVHLSEAAEARIAIELGVVETSTMRSRLTVAGELMAPPGSATSLTAPRAAVVLAPEGGRPPVPGEFVQAGQPLLRLATMQADPARIAEELGVAEARLANAQAKVERAQRLLDAGIGSRAELEDAQQEMRSAEAVARSARAQQALLGGSGAPSGQQGLSAVTLNAPHEGVIQAVRVSVGQTVSDGAPLLELVQASPLWVRVPVYVGDVQDVDPDGSAVLLDPSAPEGQVGASVTPVRGPRTADAAAASADLFYSLANPGTRFRPGQRVQISLPLLADAAGIVVPWSAVLHDMNGGTWIYEALGDRAYTRRRVEVREVADGMALLGRGPAPGTRIVVVGAAELFSIEFGGATH